MRLVDGHRGRLVVAFVVSALASVPAFCVPLAIGQAVDGMRAQDDAEVTRWALVLGALAILTAALWAVRMVTVARASFGLEAALRQRYFDHLTRLDLAEIEGEDAGQLVARGTADLRSVRVFVSAGVPAIAQVVAGFVFVIAATAARHPLLGLIAVGPVAGVLVASRLQVRDGLDQVHDSRRQLGDVTREIDETLIGMPLVRAHGQREERLSRVRGSVLAALGGLRAVLRRNARFTAIVSTLPLVGVVAVLVVGARLAIEHQISDGEFVSVYLLLLMLAGPTSALGAVVMLAQAAGAAARRVAEVLDKPTMTDTGAASPAAGHRPGAVGLRSVVAGFVPGDVVLEGADAEIRPGRHVALAGGAGSGKSLMLALVKRLYPLGGGSVVIDGTDLASLDRAALGDLVALATEDDAVFPGTVRDTIAYGRPRASDADVRRAAGLADATHMVEGLPNGFDTPLAGQGAVTLSGGQRQRLTLARALLLEPPVLLIDGATSSLDAVTERAVMANIRHAHPEQTVIATGQREAVLAEADEVITLAGGLVTRADTPRRAAAAPAQAPGSGSPARAAPAAEPPAPAAVQEALRERRRRLARSRRRVIGELLRPERRRMIVAALTVVVMTVATLTPAYIAARVLDDVLGPRSLESVDRLGLILGLAVVVIFASTWASSYLIPRVGRTAIARLRVTAFERLLRVPMSYFDRLTPGQIVSRLTNNVETLASLAVSALGTLVVATVMLAGTGLVLILIDPRLALVAYVTVPPLVLMSLAFRQALRRPVAGIENLTVYLRDTVRGARTMRAYGGEAAHRAHFAELNELERVALRRSAYVFGAFTIGVELLVGLDVALLVLVGGHQAIDGAVTVGTMVAFSTYLRGAVMPLSTLATLNASYDQATSGLDEIVEIVDQPEDPDGDGATPEVVAGTAATLRFEDVWFAYDQRGWVLRGVDLDIPAGGTLLLVGSTGAGKTSIARLLLRFYRPTRGTITIDGSDLAGVPDAWLRTQIGYVPQQPFLFTGTVSDNIAFARPDATRADVERVVDELGMTAALATLPDGLDTKVGAGGAPVSSGQRQLMALARALLVDPRLLVLDEATSVMDPDTEEVVERALSHLRTGRTTLVIAHRLTRARRSDEIALIAGGRIVERGGHDELLATGGSYATLWLAASGARGR